MFTMFSLFFLISTVLPLVHGHAALFHPSMWGFNVTAQTFPYDNRPVAPLQNYTFEKWWWHNYFDYPPNAGDIFELPAGQPATTELSCDKGATSFFASSPGGDVRSGNNPCPGSPLTTIHAKNPQDVKGCALAITYQSDEKKVQPEDFAVFSVNQTCILHRFTDFAVPENMPPCPEGGCICSFFWIHSPDAGSEQNYMNPFRCNVTNSKSTVPIATAKVPRRCGADPANKKPVAAPSNCTYGAKQPFYWFQAERNNMFEGPFSPPFYSDLYNFVDGPQDDIFENSVLPKFKNATFADNEGDPNAATASILANSTSVAVSSTASALSTSTASVTSTPESVSASGVITVFRTIVSTVTLVAPSSSSTSLTTAKTDSTTSVQTSSHSASSIASSTTTHGFSTIAIVSSPVPTTSTASSSTSAVTSSSESSSETTSAPLSSSTKTPASSSIQTASSTIILIPAPESTASASLLIPANTTAAQPTTAFAVFDDDSSTPSTLPLGSSSGTCKRSNVLTAASVSQRKKRWLYGGIDRRTGTLKRHSLWGYW